MLEKFTKEELEIIKRELKALEMAKVSKGNANGEAFKRLDDEIGWVHACYEMKRALTMIADLTIGAYKIRTSVYAVNGREREIEDVHRNTKLTQLECPKYKELMDEMVDVILDYYVDVREDRKVD